MLQSLRLRNFRRFQDHQLRFGPTTILVGPNNAGKSTLVEALRLIALAVRYGPWVTFEDAPGWTGLPEGSRGVRPRLADRGFDLRGAIHRLGDPPASIRAEFASGHGVEVFIGEGEEVFAVLRFEDGDLAANKSEALRLGLDHIAIQPQVAPLAWEEKLRDQRYVARYEGSARAPQHFRNQLLFASAGELREFKENAERGWRGLQIRECFADQDGSVHLIVREPSFAGEISMMGHGLQMWLQTLWFIVRNRHASTVVLDEPDVYMHADLQRGLIGQLRSRHRQVVIATHSIEIMSEVDAEEIVVIDASAPESLPAADLAAVQQVIERMGGVHNLQLTRMWRARRVLLVEGDDLTVLERLHATLSPDAMPLGASPAWSIGGWGGYPYAVGSSMALKNAAGQRIRTYCVLDRDYHVDEEIRERFSSAKAKGIDLHVWKRKEIENYLLVPAAIARLIEAGHRRGRPPLVDEVAERLDAIAEGFRQEVFLAHVDAHSDRGRGKSRSRDAAAYAARVMEERYGNADSRIAACPGKRVLRELRKWSQKQYGVSLSAPAIATELLESEVDAEMRGVLRAIEATRALPEVWRFPAAPAV